MKRIFLFLTLAAFFVASVAEAAPARNTRTSSGTKATTTKKVSTQKSATKTAKKTTKKVPKTTQSKKLANQQIGVQQRGREEQLGLMPSELDYLNHNVFHADAAAIRGARETEQALRYLPFVTITNTAGFGSQFDMRGQGRLASNGVKMYINGVSANPVDSYYGFMPINTIIPSLIQEIEVYPGSGAVLYGSGTKGGTINIITSKRQNPYFMVGGGYLNSHGTNSFNAFAQAAEKFGTIGVNAGVAYSQLGGPREDDKSQNAQAVLGATVPVGYGAQIDFDVDFYYGKKKGTPYNTLIDEAGIRSAMLNTPFTGAGTTGWEESTRQNAALTVPSLEPDKNDRGTGGLGETDTTQMRLNASLGYTADLAQKLQWNVTGRFAMDNRKFNTYSIYTPAFVLGGTDLATFSPSNTWYVMRPLPQSFANIANINPLVDGISGEYPYLDLSGSTFNELKGGLKTELNWKHDNGELIFGLSGLYEKSKRNPKSYLRSAIPWIYGTTDGAVQASYFRATEATLDDNMDINVITAAVYMYDRYRLSPEFSIAGGARYEMKNYNVKVEDHYKANRMVMQLDNNAYEATQNPSDRYVIGGDNFIRDLYSNSADPINNPTHEYKQNYDNFTFELSPAFNYSKTGLIYLHGEFGYVAPPAWAMVQRFGKFLTYGHNAVPNTIATDPNDTTTSNIPNQGNTTGRYTLAFDYIDTELKSETYWTAELGWKESIVNRQVPLGFMDLDINALLFSVSAFYTDSKNEFFFDGDTYSGMTFGNYDKSRRIGAEVALEQIILGNVVSLNESFTYLRAQYQEGGEWQTIPYTYDWKGTLGAALDIAGFVEIVDVGFSVWLQNSIYGNQQVPTREVTAYSPEKNQVQYIIGETTTKKLDPYIISDLGITVSFGKEMVSITAGVKNLFDTFYYDYYNNDKAAVVNENRFLIGRGRTVFVEGVFKY